MQPRHLQRTGCSRTAKTTPYATPATRKRAATTSAQPPAAVLWVDGAPAAACSASPQAVLSAHPDGAYTTAYVADGTRIVDWHLHLQRLKKNMQRLNSSRPPAFQHTLSWLAQQEVSAEDALQHLLSTAVAGALTSLQQQEPGLQAAVLVVSLQQAVQRTPDVPPATSAASAAGQLQPAAEAVAAPAVGPQAPPSSSSGCGCSDAAASAAGQDGVDGSSVATAAGLSYLVYCKAVPPTPAAPPPISVLASEGVRQDALVKHNRWVVDRQQLEALRAAAGVQEVLLMGPQQQLLEGLVSNFYVIVETDGGLTLQTNGPQDAALPGVMQQRVLEAAAQLGLQVQLSAPRLNDVGTWKEAFVTNCLRGVQPVSTIQWTDSNNQDVTSQQQQALSQQQQLTLPAAPGPITQQLQQLVPQLQTLTSAINTGGQQ